MNKKRTQLLLMMTVLFITVSIVTLFSLFSYNNLKQQMVTQILQDNKTLGEHLFQLFSDELYLEKSPEEQIAFLQKFADDISLPNGGFVCALAPEGEVVAYPGLQKGQKMSIGSFTIHENGGERTGTFQELEKGEIFKGFLREPNKEDQIIYSRPLGDTPLRLNIHQRMEDVHKSITKLLYPSLIIGIILSFLGALLVYYLSDRIVKSYESQLELLNADLQEVNRERKQLLRVLSHDISNPLSVIEMATALTDFSQIENDELRGNMEMIGTSVRQAMEIIQLNREMLALEDRKQDLTLQSVSVEEKVQEMLQVVQKRLDDKDLALDIAIEEGLTAYVEPVSFLNSVLNNIMTNAIKFSFPHSSILFTAKTVDEKCHITIKDSGIGMSEGLLDKLFHPHEKTSRRGTSDEVGTGFGMPIMKRFVELYGGEVIVESVEGKKDQRVHGTTFHLILSIGK